MGNCAELIENSFGRSQIFRSPSHGKRDFRDKIVDTELTGQIGQLKYGTPAMDRSQIQLSSYYVSDYIALNDFSYIRLHNY